MNAAPGADDVEGMDPFGRTFNRLLAVFGLAIAFVALASVVSPRFSAAEPGPGHSLAEGRIVGRLIGTEHEVVIVATRLGPRYNVYDLNGAPLASDLTIEQLDQRFAGLSAMVSDMRSGGVTRLGVVDVPSRDSAAGDR